MIQFECGDTQAGQTGCLQYFTGATGTIASFNFPMGLTTVAATGTVQSKIQLTKMLFIWRFVFISVQTKCNKGWFKVMASYLQHTPPIPEIIWVKNVRTIVVCGFLMK